MEVLTKLSVFVYSLIIQLVIINDKLVHRLHVPEIYLLKINLMHLVYFTFYFSILYIRVIVKRQEILDKRCLWILTLRFIKL